MTFSALFKKYSFDEACNLGMDGFKIQRATWPKDLAIGFKFHLESNTFFKDKNKLSGHLWYLLDFNTAEIIGEYHFSEEDFNSLDWLIY